METTSINHFSGTTKVGTTGGTLTIILANIHSSDIIKTIILAAIGAAVSFTISFLLNYFVSKRRK